MIEEITESIKNYFFHWYGKNKFDLLVFIGVLAFIYYLNRQYKINYKPKIKVKSPLEILEEEKKLGKINNLDYEKRKIKLLQK